MNYSRKYDFIGSLGRLIEFYNVMLKIDFGNLLRMHQTGLILI